MKKSQPSWTHIKAKLSTFDRPGLIALIQDLYGAHKDNRTFLHARFGLGEDVLEPYKKTIKRWVSPDVFSRSQDISISKAKQAVADFKKAVGDPAGLAELMVFYCECAANFCSEFGNDDGDYYSALVRMFEQAVMVANTLPPDNRDTLIDRLEEVCAVSQSFGYGVSDSMQDLLADQNDDQRPVD